LSNIVGIIRYRKVSLDIMRGQKEHLEVSVPSGDFQVLHCLGIRLLVLGI